MNDGNEKKKRTRRKFRSVRYLTPAEFEELQALHKEHLVSEAKLLETERQILELMALREEQRKLKNATGVSALSKRFGYGVTVIIYACRPRNCFTV